MKCEICDQEFVNSIELEKHKEREHPMGDVDLEKPDLLQEEEDKNAPSYPERN